MMYNKSEIEKNDVMIEDIYAEKRKKALEFLGENWVLHPNYKPNPKHSLLGSDTAKFATMRTKRTLEI